MFWGAPLVTRELEVGTFRLAWNQSVTRTRWMAVKLAPDGLAAMVTTGLLDLVRHLVGQSGQPPPADSHQLRSAEPFLAGRVQRTQSVPVGYTAFGFDLGHRRRAHPRALPAIAITVAVLLASSSSCPT